MGDNFKEADNLEKALPNEPKIVGCNVCMLVSYDEKEKLNKFEKAYKQREERDEMERLIKELEEKERNKPMCKIIPYDEEKKKEIIKKIEKENKYKNMYGF